MLLEGGLHVIGKKITTFKQQQKKGTNFRHKEPFARLVYLQTGTEIAIIRTNSYS